MSPTPLFYDGPTWAVDRIVTSARRGGRQVYLVRWKDTWEPAEGLHGTADTAIEEYNALGRSTRRSGKGGP
jgi:hypothetical protein